MKKNIFRTTTLVFLLCVMVLALGGCETARGLGRDIKDGDKWIREHLW